MERFICHCFACDDHEQANAINTAIGNVFQLIAEEKDKAGGMRELQVSFLMNGRGGISICPLSLSLSLSLLSRSLSLFVHSYCLMMFIVMCSRL